MYHCKCQLIYRTLGGLIPVLTEDRLNMCVNVCIIYIIYIHTHILNYRFTTSTFMYIACVCVVGVFVNN